MNLAHSGHSPFDRAQIRFRAAVDQCDIDAAEAALREMFRIARERDARRERGIQGGRGV